jgi:hypothetical protein
MGIAFIACMRLHILTKRGNTMNVQREYSIQEAMDIALQSLVVERQLVDRLYRIRQEAKEVADLLTKAKERRLQLDQEARLD